MFQANSYLREFSGRVVEAREDGVVLDQTCFHPTPYGGLDSDTGVIIGRGRVYRVGRAVMEGGKVVHVIGGHDLREGDAVFGKLDWGRRYAMMRLHTASHVLAAIMYENHGALVTGGHITWEYSREDFGLEAENWKEVFREAVERANEVMAKCIEVRVYWVPRERAMRIPGVVKLAERLPPEVSELRIVEIPGVDVQADGGPHVSNTCEVGGVEIFNMESRGRRKKRVYIRLSGP